MSNFWHSMRYMKPYNTNKNKERYFVNFQRKSMIMIFRSSLFIKRSYNIFLLTSIMFRHVKIWKHIECMHQKLSKNMLFVKLHLRMKRLYVFLFFFFSSRDEFSSLSFWQAWTHPGTSFVPGWNVTCKYPLRGTLYVKCHPGIKLPTSQVKCLILFICFSRNEISTRNEIKKKNV